MSGEVLVFSATDTEQCHYFNITDDRECEYDGCESEFFMSQLSTDEYTMCSWSAPLRKLSLKTEKRMSAVSSTKCNSNLPHSLEQK